MTQRKNLSYWRFIGIGVLMSSAALVRPAEAKDCVTTVVAVVNIADGATIKSRQVAEKKILRAELPRGIYSLLELEAAHSENFQSFYPNTIKDVVGRLSRGIRKGETLFGRFPGLGSNRVTLARRNLPVGERISPADEEEQAINPIDIPTWSIRSPNEAIKQISSGITKGQVIVELLDSNKKPKYCGQWPGKEQGLEIVYAVRPIRKGSTISGGDVKHTHLSRRARSEQEIPWYVQHPEGATTKYQIEEGQIITRQCLVERN